VPVVVHVSMGCPKLRNLRQQWARRSVASTPELDCDKSRESQILKESGKLYSPHSYSVSNSQHQGCAGPSSISSGKCCAKLVVRMIHIKVSIGKVEKKLRLGFRIYLADKYCCPDHARNMWKTCTKTWTPSYPLNFRSFIRRGKDGYRPRVAQADHRSCEKRPMVEYVVLEVAGPLFS
jgi:hypothetical protein